MQVLRSSSLVARWQTGQDTCVGKTRTVADMGWVLLGSATGAEREGTLRQFYYVVKKSNMVNNWYSVGWIFNQRSCELLSGFGEVGENEDQPKITHTEAEYPRESHSL